MPSYPQMVPPALYNLQLRDIAAYLSTLPRVPPGALGNADGSGSLGGVPDVPAGWRSNQFSGIPPTGTRQPEAWMAPPTRRPVGVLMPERVIPTPPELASIAPPTPEPLGPDTAPYAGLIPGEIPDNPWGNSPQIQSYQQPPEMPGGVPRPEIGGANAAMAQPMTQQQPAGRQPFAQLNQVPPNPMQSAAQMPQGQMPQGQQQPGQQGGSNAMLMGILSAGLGILANNTGHYGAAGPAIGRGGQIGLGTYLQQSQQEIENTRRDALAKAAEVKWQQQAESLKEVARHNRSMEDKSKYMVVGPGQMLTADGKEVFTNTNEKPGGTQYERALEILRSAELKHRRGEQLTPEEQLHAQDSAALLSRQQMYQDTRTGQWFIQPPMDISHYQSVAKVPPGGAHLASVPGLAVPNAPGAGRIALDAGTEKEMQGLGDARAQLNNLIPQFKDEYGGFSLDAAGQLAIEAGRRLPEGTLGANPDLANWWQSYYNWSNDVRAAKFGLTLTGNELTAFERATPKPGDDPKIIRRALAKQLAILEEKGKRRIDSIKAGGGNVPQAEALYGRGNAATSQDMTGTPTRIRTPAEMFKGK